MRLGAIGLILAEKCHVSDYVLTRALCPWGEGRPWSVGRSRESSRSPGVTQTRGDGGLAQGGCPNSHVLLLWGSHPTFSDSMKEETYIT